VLEIAASEFKTKFLELMDRLAARKLNRIVVTKRGRPVAVLTPPPAPEEIAETFFGLIEGSVGAPEDFDFSEPARRAARRGRRNSAPVMPWLSLDT